MSNEKLTDKEEAALDQTFGEYGEESAETATATPVVEDPSAPKKKSGNAVIFLGAGVAAVLFVGYKFFLAPMISPPQPPHVAINQPVQTAAPAVTPIAVTPIAVTGPAANAAVATAPEATLAKEFMASSGQPTSSPPTIAATLPPTPPTPAIQLVNVPQTVPQSETVATAPLSQVNVGVAPGNMAAPVVGQGGQPPVSVTLNVAPPQPVPVPVVVTTLPAPVVVAKDDGKVINMLEEIRGLFEKQTKDTRDSIGLLDKRVGSLEQGQTDLVKNMEARLSKLESNRVIRAIPVSRPAPVVQDNGDKVIVDKPVRVSRKPMQNKTPKPVLAVDTNRGDGVLFTNDSDRPSAAKETKEEDSLGKYVIHAIYGNRFYLRSADGTHKSYVVGDKLPEGEVVTKIDDEKYQIVTNKGTIRAF